MDDLTELPIIYTTMVLIPGNIIKIVLNVKNDNFLIDLLLKIQNSKETYIIGVIPKIDFEKVDNVIGTVAKFQSIIQTDSVYEEFALFVQGIQRFLLGETISEKPMKINKITVIKEPFLEILGDENKYDELKAEFEKVLTDFYTLTRFGKNLPFNGNIKALFKKYSIHQIIENCFDDFLILTQVDSYEVLRATSLEKLMKVVINLLKRLIVEDKMFKVSNKSYITSIPISYKPPVIPSFSFDSMNDKNTLLVELQDLRTALVNSNLPTHINDLVLKDLTRLEKIDHFNIEYSILINYLNYVINLPWNKTTKETLDLQKAKNIMQKYHYGMDKVKKRILQFIAIRKLNPNQRGPILCFVGPSGVGKTSIAKAIADSLDRTIKRVSLSGINCYSDIKGFEKSFVGAMPGCIMQAINQTQTKNPIILLDEIDKMYEGSSSKNTAALLEVLDPEQNSSFVDSYVNLPFDLSQVMFIATANNVNQIQHMLRDRLEIIHLDGYTHEEKVVIAENYLIPKILKDYKMDELQITIFKNTINDIITKYTAESGVRELQRKIEAIYEYIAVKLVENEDEKNKNHLITPDSLMDILGNEVCYGAIDTLVKQSCDKIGVAIGLSSNSVFVIETSEVHSKTGKNSLVLTGLAGRILKDSAEIAFSWIIEFAEKNKLKRNDFSVHIHRPKGEHKNDLSSTGISIVCALASLFWKVPLKPMVAMTGEISLQGYILSVDGIKQKIHTAYYANIKTVIIPELNIDDTKDLPKSILEDLNIIPVKHIEDVLESVFPGGLSFFQNPIANIVLKSKI